MPVVEVDQLEPGRRKPNVMVWFGHGKAGLAWSALCTLLVLMLDVAGCAAQNPAANDPLPDADWVRPDVTVQGDFGPPGCGSLSSVQPLEVSVVGDPKVRDRELGDRITNYLNDHCLPLVRASVASLDDWEPRVLLYGFVPSDSDRRNAEAKTAALLVNSGIAIADAIMVRPQLASPGARPLNIPKRADNASPDGGSAELDDPAQVMVIQGYDNIDQYGPMATSAPSVGSEMDDGAIGERGGIFVAPGSGWYPGVVPGNGPAFSSLPGGTGWKNPPQ